MEVFHIKSIIHPVIDPESLFCPLAFRAMAVATVIITDPFFTAKIAVRYSLISSSERFSGSLLNSKLMRAIDFTYFSSIKLSQPVFWGGI